MKKLLLIGCLCMIHFVNAQDDFDLKFQNYSPVWSHTPQFDNFDAEIGAFHALVPVILNENLYFPYNVYSLEEDGIFVEKLDVNSGEQMNYFGSLQSKKERILKCFINDMQLHLLSFTALPQNKSFFWYSGSLVERKLDMDDLSVKYKNIINDSIFIRSDYTLEHVVLRTDLYPFRNGFSSFEAVKTVGFISLRSVIFDHDSHLVLDSTVNLKTNFPLYSHREMSVKKLNDSTNLVLRQLNEDNNKNDIFKLHLFFIDNYLNIQKKIDLSSKVSIAEYHKLIFVDSSHILISSTTEDEVYKDGQEIKTAYQLFDLDGKSIEKVTVYNNSKSMFYHSTNCIKLKNNQLLVVNFDRDSLSNRTITFLKSNGQGVLDTMKVLKLEKGIYWCKVGQIKETNDGDILLYLQVKFLKQNILKNFWMLFDKESLELYNSPNNILDNLKIQFSVSPNPASHTIKITPNTKIQPKYIQIFNTIGQKIKSLPYQATLDLSHFEKGIYFIRLQGENGIGLGVKRVVVN